MIKVKNIFKSFGSHAVLNDVSFDVTTGSVVAVIGPSGSGKSTLLKCLNGLETPESGEIYLDGQLLTAETLKSLQRKVGMVFQHFNLFNNMNVLENVTYAPISVKKESRKVAEDKALAILNKMGLANKTDAYPQKLSGGQKQRVGIARALAMEPEILLLDEPTSALDPEMVKEVLLCIKDLAHSGITLVMNTHEMNFAKEIADEILFLDNGKVIERAPPATLFQNPKSERVKYFLDQVL